MFASPAERSGMAMLGRKVPGVGGIEGYREEEAWTLFTLPNVI